ncbi:MAG: transposase [Candidatus Solibacter usitatus]|nr:transposase [Candidatus Solibacter usitatus]
MEVRRKFTKAVKEAAVQRVTGGQSLSEVARALEVHPSDVHRWRRELQEHGERAFLGPGHQRTEETKIAALERKIGQQALEIDFLKRALQHVEDQRRLQALNNGARSMRKLKKK